MAALLRKDESLLGNAFTFGANVMRDEWKVCFLVSGGIAISLAIILVAIIRNSIFSKFALLTGFRVAFFFFCFAAFLSNKQYLSLVDVIQRESEEEQSQIQNLISPLSMSAEEILHSVAQFPLLLENTRNGLLVALHEIDSKIKP